jgi:hypothetical protein
MNIPTVFNDLPSLNKLVQTIYENDAMLLPDPLDTNDVENICARIQEHKRSIGSKRKGYKVLQWRYFIGLDLQRLLILSPILYVDACVRLNLPDGFAKEHIRYIFE